MSDARGNAGRLAAAIGLGPLQAQAAFPKAARLLKTDEFSSVFRLRPWRRSAHFVVYARPTGSDARLGLVIGKKFAPRAATRNLVRRIARETFRLRRADFGGWDVLLRLHTRVNKTAYPSAASRPLKALCRTEIEALLEHVASEIARRERQSVVAPAAPVPPSPPAPAGRAEH
ncbi:ribonuclease P protein component [Trinickia sp. LjRoot230]|uniref:ribonuclease P protein component n=1 Tax=Trinickia sp. LjRoot230 TaxID=3342288 RepID=UPI003ED06B2C